MVTGIAVKDIDVVNLIKVMLQGIGTEHACYPRVKAGAQQRRNACLFELLPISPLPLVLKLCRILRLIVGSVHIAYLALQAGIHDGQVLIRQCQIQHHIRLHPFDEGYQLLHAVGIHLGRGDFALAPLQLFLQGIALADSTAGDADFLKGIAVLHALVNCHAGHAAAADN